MVAASLLYHEKITADNSAYRGIHPIVCIESHQTNLAKLINGAVWKLPSAELYPHENLQKVIALQSKDGPVYKEKPDFISVTRGPGVRANLFTGLDTAKGLAAAWQIPFLGIHHMQAHALTPRLVSAMNVSPKQPADPAFPFLSLLVSGGHTMLINSTSLTDHRILATTLDIAIGDALDKAAREIVPEDILRTSQDSMYGRILERFAFPNGAEDYSYAPPATREQEISPRLTKYGWAFGPPLADTKSMEFTFSGLSSSVPRFLKQRADDLDLEERRDMAREFLRVSFEHLASRVVLGLNEMQAEDNDNFGQLKYLVVSGGVASNGYLRHLLRSFLDIRGYSGLELVFPPPSWCTDNAAMIAWAGIEMFEAGWESDLSCMALRKWSMDPAAEDGGILGVGGWKRLVA